ncbi:MAG: protein-L-isoaspartate(D-aspartate) O-methyltransferase [Phycisphaerales bacterium]
MSIRWEEPACLRVRLHLLLLGLVLFALAFGCSPASENGSGCTGRRSPPETSPVVGEEEPPPANVDAARHPAFAERVPEREQMVAVQIQARGVRDPNVLRAMRSVPRHAFVPESLRGLAYADHPLDIGHDQTISQPYIVAFMTEALALDPNSVVLEIGTGSGYQAAVCAEIAREVYSVEILEPLAKSAIEALTKLGYGNVHVRVGDGFYGWPDKGPFDAIIGTAAAQEVPPPLIEQLKPGGRMILPVEGEHGFQHLILLTKDEGGQLHRKAVMPVRFVPMTGRSRRSQE